MEIKSKYLKTLCLQQIIYDRHLRDFWEREEAPVQTRRQTDLPN